MTKKRTLGTLNQLMSRLLGLAAGILIATMLFAAVQGANREPTEFSLCGQPESQVKIEVFSDYQCPHCRTFYLNTIKPLIAGFTREKKIDDVHIVYHDLPLDMHQYARKAASYALAAARLGRDPWLRVADCLYQEQAAWAQDGNIESVISKVLDNAEMAKVKMYVADPAIEQTIRDEIALAQVRQIRGTPTFFIFTQAGRQERVNGSVPYELLKGRIESVLR